MSSKRYAVIGDPISHSLSPLMHNGWIADYDLDATYEALLLRGADPAGEIRALTGYAGLNVTVPHKEAAARAADERDAIVERLQAANTLTWKGGRLIATNTDFGGFGRALDDAAPEWRRADNALVIGAGGAGRSVAFSLAGQDGPRVTIVNRTFARADEVARLVDSYAGQGAAARPWSELAACIADADLIVNTTSLNLAQGESFDWPLSAAKPSALVADIVYRPLETDLLRAARAQGMRTMDGLGMLIHQGALAFELWFAIKPDVAKARARLMAALT
jgi:shikimate dehydrogenase